MEHSDDSYKPYCPWLDESPTSLRIIDSHTPPRQRVIPKKMKKLIDGDLAAISEKRKSTKDRLKEKLRLKQEAKDQDLQEIVNKNVAVYTDVDQKSAKQKKRRKRSKKASVPEKQENEAKNEDAKPVESADKIEVEESSKKADGEVSVPTEDKINADTLLAEIEKLREDISVLISNEVKVETLFAEIEKFGGGISGTTDNEINADILINETEKLSEDISVPTDYELNADRILTEIKKLDGEISVPIDFKGNADRLLAEIEQLSKEISLLFDNEENAETLRAEIEKFSREISEPLDHQVNADTNTDSLDVEKPDVQFSVHIDEQKDSETLLADTVKFSGDIVEPFKASTLLLKVEKPNEEISKSTDIKENDNKSLAEIENFGRDTAKPVDNSVNADAHLAEIEKPDEEISLHTENVDTLIAEMKKLREDIFNLVNNNNNINADTFTAEGEKLNGEITEPTDKAANADTISYETEKLSGEMSVRINNKLNIDKLLTEIKKLDEEISVHMENKVNAETLSVDIENLSEKISELIDNEENADTLLAEIQKLNRAISEPNDCQMNADGLLAESQKPDGEFTVHTGYQDDEETLSAEIKRPDTEIDVPTDNIRNADTLLTDTSIPSDIKINAYVILAEIEKVSEEISVLFDSKTNMDTLLAETEKLNREIYEPIDNEVNNDIPLAEVGKFGGTITVPVYNKVNPGTLLAEIQTLKGDIFVPVNKDWEMTALHDIKVNANALLAESETDKTKHATQGASKEFTLCGQFKKRIDSEKYSIVADNLHNKLRRNHRVEISMSERKKLIGNMKSEVVLLKKSMELLLTHVSQKVDSKVVTLSPEKINCNDVAKAARLGCEIDFELYTCSVLPSQPSIIKQQLAAKHSRPGRKFIKGAHQEVLHKHLRISEKKTCLENVEQKSFTQKIEKQKPLVNENSVSEVKYSPVFLISEVISDLTQNTQIISITEIKEKKRLLAHSLMGSQNLRDQFSEIITLVQDVREIGLLFMEGINQMKKMKTSLELAKWPDVSNSVLLAQIGFGRLFILCCYSGPGLFDIFAAVKIHGLTNTLMSKGITCSTEKFLQARMRQRYVLSILGPSATGRYALPKAICSWAVDFTQSDLRIYSTVEGMKSALDEVKPWIKMKTGNIMNIYSILQNIRMRQKFATVQIVELCRKATMIGSEIIFVSHCDKIQLSINDGGQFNYKGMLNDMVSKYMYLQGQQGVLPVLETTRSSHKGLKAYFMNCTIPIAMTGCLIKPVVMNGFLKNAVKVQHEDFLGPEGLKSLNKMNILQNKASLLVKETSTNIQGNMVQADFEFKIRENYKFKGSLAQRGNFHLNKKVNAQNACDKREENEATLPVVENLRLSQNYKNLTFRGYDDGMKEIEKYSAFNRQSATRSATETTATETARKYIERLQEQISKKLAVKREVNQQMETVKILPLNLNSFPSFAKRHELLKLRKSERNVRTESVQETWAVERLSIDDNNTPCSQVNDEAPGQIHHHSGNINIIDSLEQTHYGIRLCMFD